jgi:hypothetical protein
MAEMLEKFAKVKTLENLATFMMLEMFLSICDSSCYLLAEGRDETLGDLLE